MAADSQRLPGTFSSSRINQQQAVGSPQAVDQDVKSEQRISSELARPYSVGIAPTHTTPGSPPPPPPPERPRVRWNIRSPYAQTLPQRLWLANDFLIVRLLEQGSEGKVYLVKHRETGEVVALKKLEAPAPCRNVFDLPEECLFQLNNIPLHRHIVFMSQVDIDKEARVWQCMQFCNGGDLLDFCERTRAKRMDDTTRMIFALHVFIQLGEALAFLHYGLKRNPTNGRWTVHADYKAPILHSDVKPENVMLHFDDTNEFGLPDIRLGDFGHAAWADKPHHIAGSPSFYSPEAKAHDEGREGPPMQMASDVYTFGLTMHYLVTGRRFSPAAPTRKLKLPRPYDEMDMTRAIRWCLNLNPNARPKMNCSGLLRCVDHAYRERSQLHSRMGHLGYFWWLSWCSEALKAEREA